MTERNAGVLRGHTKTEFLHSSLISLFQYNHLYNCVPFEDLALDFEGTADSGAERFYRRILDKLRLKEKRCSPYRDTKTDRISQEEQKTAAAVYQSQADNDGEWGELRLDFENGTAEIVRLADWDTVKSNIFAKTAMQFVQGLPKTRLPKEAAVPFQQEKLDLLWP